VPPETVLCRCQALTRANLDACVSLEGVKDLATLKRLTRAGMGRCQGRYCEATLRALYAFERQVGERGDFAPQAPLRPIPLAAIAGASTYRRRRPSRANRLASPRLRH
jgi:EAL domain-containing protein (putative c-di-GMP-specific phosphodiesterase class I)